MVWWEIYLIGALAFAIYIIINITPKIIDRAKIHRVGRFTKIYAVMFTLLLPIYCFILFPIFFIPVMSNEAKFIKHFAEGDK